MRVCVRWWMTARGDTYGASRRAELIDHGEADGIDGSVLRHRRQMDDLARSGAEGGQHDCGPARRHSSALHHRAACACPAAGSTISRNSSPHRPAAHPSLAIDHLARLYGKRLRQCWHLAGEPAGNSRTAFAVRRHRRAGALCRPAGNGADAGGCGDAAHRHRPARAIPADAALNRPPTSWPRELGWDAGPPRPRNRIARTQFPDAAEDRRAMSAFVVVNPRSGGGRTGARMAPDRTRLARGLSRHAGR